MCCCAIACVKCFLYFLDILFLLSGIGLFITGIHVLVGVTLLTHGLVICILIFFQFYFMVVVVICLEVSAIIIAFAGLHMHDDMTSYVTASMKRGLFYYQDENHSEMKAAWDSLQQEVECCGVNAPTDWEITGGFPPGEVPGSCCNGPDGACTSYYMEGCQDYILMTLEDWLLLIGVVCIVFVIIQILLVWFILILFFKLHRGSKYCCGCGVYSSVKEHD
nr:tetraspanin-9-like [Lytechinus pictus]